MTNSKLHPEHSGPNRKLICALVFLTSVTCHLSSANAQQFGGTPASIHWRQVNTDTVRVIFPEGFEEKAKRIASVVHYLQQNYSRTIGTSLRKISIVVQDQGLVSNGYVGLGPYRSEFYVTPPQDPFQLGAVKWSDLLAVHEFRHVQQYSNFNKGLARVASTLFGQEAQALANATAIPDWFFEGDAVFNETRLTQQGRGTLPLFLSSYQSVYNSHRQYSYAKMRNGSLRQYVPDHYDLGYLLVAYGRKKFGDESWRDITADAAAFKPLFYPFQGSFKKHTGTPFGLFVKEAMNYYREQWDLARKDSVNWITTTNPNSVTNYKYLYHAPDGSVIVLKNSYREIPAFYRVSPNGNEEKIAVRDIGAEDYFSYNNGRLVYTSLQPDTRWGNRDFNRVKMLDIATGNETTITAHSKYFSPDISHDGNKIVAAESGPLMSSRVVTMNLAGNLTDSLSAPGIFFSNPKFAANDSAYYVAARNEKGEMQLLKRKLGAAKIDTLVAFSNRIIGFLTVTNDTVLFSTTYKGRDEIWSVIDEPAILKGPFRLASYQTGLYQATLQGDGRLAVSAFTADGYRLGFMPPQWERVPIKDELSPLYVGSLFNKTDKQMLDQVPDRPFGTSRYRKSFNLLNFHSLRPAYDNPEYSLTLYGQNVLNTFQSELSYTYNENEASHKLGYNGIFGGTYIQPVFGVNQTWNRSVTYSKDTVFHWNEFAGYAGLQLPLNLSAGKQYRYLTLASTFNADLVHWTGTAEKLLRNQDVNYLSSRIVYTGQIQKAVQHIYPHWAQSLLLQYRNSVNNYAAHQFLASGSLYLPGAGTNHSIVITAAYQGRDTLRQYAFTNNFPFSRGYSAVDFPSMWRLGFNYHVPLAYPDWGFGNIVYFQRIRANGFYDHTEGKSIRTGLIYPFHTVGAELYFDTKWWNQQPVTFGIRYSRLLNNEFSGSTNPNTWELILPVSLFN